MQIVYDAHMAANEKIQKTNEEWKKDLTPVQYQVMREKGTEAPFTGKFYASKDKGVYICSACGNKLFSSDAKFDSGSGWPSFDRPLADGSVETVSDTSHGMERTEVVCGRCGAHLGHVFDDGPRETTGKRFCVNSVSLDMENDSSD